MTATCTDPQFNWLFNQRGQSPCEIAFDLANACNTGAGGTPYVLTPNQQYPPIAPKDANQCTCNTVRYALIVGCSACQSRSYLGYKEFTANCSQTYDQQFPITIPDTTAIPHYAYLPLYEGETFNWSAIPNQNKGFADSTAPPSPTSTTSSCEDSATATPNNSQAAQAAKDSPPNAGVIAGGVVGGLVFLCLVVAGIILLWRRRRAARIQEAVNGMGTAPGMIQNYGPEIQPPPYPSSDDDANGVPALQAFTSKSTQRMALAQTSQTSLSGDTSYYRVPRAMTASCTDPQFNWASTVHPRSTSSSAEQMYSYSTQEVKVHAKSLRNWQMPVTREVNGGVPGVLQPNQQYPALSPNDANPCTCNTVRYVMIVGCSACQSRSYLTFPQYTQSCKQTYNQQFPATIPAGTSVPHYAYLPLADGQFNWSAAQQDHNPNESSGGAAPPPSTTKQTQAATTPNSPPQTTQNNPTQAQVTNNGNQNTPVTVPPQNTNAAGSTNAANTTPTQGSVSTIASNGVTTVVTFGPTSAQDASGTGAPQTNGSSTSGGSSKAGPIAGGVVGGIAVICLFLAFLWLLRQRERRLRDELAALRPSPMMAQTRGARDAEAAEPPPYMPSDAATIGSSELAPLRKPAHRGNTYQPSMASGDHPGPCGHRPMLSEGGSSAALTGYASTGPYSGSD